MSQCLPPVFAEDQLPPGFPTIDMGPQLKVVERTRTATMLCAASGNPDPDITWFKDFLPVNTTNNNGRIKQLRSGRFPLLKTQLPNRETSIFLFFSFLSDLLPHYILCSFIPSTSCHDLTSHLAFGFIGNGIVSTISCLLLAVHPCCLSLCVTLCLPVLSWAVGIVSFLCTQTFTLTSAHIAHCCDFLTNTFFCSPLFWFYSSLHWCSISSNHFSSLLTPFNKHLATLRAFKLGEHAKKPFNNPYMFVL